MVLTALLVTACSYPTASVSTVAAQPMLRVVGAPATATLVIDTQPAGPAMAYGEGGRALLVSHGTHRVAVMDGPVALYSGDVYFGDDTTRTITLAPVAP